MDYSKIYNKIVSRAESRKLTCYTEKHHILPKCMGGSNEIENICILTAREHFLCHMLLCEIHPKEYKLKHALFLMAVGKQKIKEKQYIIGSRVYERLRKEYSQMLTGVEQSKETKLKKSIAMKAVWASKTDEEMSLKSKKGWETRVKNGTDKLTPEHSKNISNSLKGRKINWDTKMSKCILQYDLEGNFIREWASISSAQREVGGDIKSAVAGRQKTSAGFTWKYKK